MPLTNINLEALRTRVRSTSLIAIAAVMMVAGLVPLTFQGSANAATLSTRSVTISNSTPSATGVTYTVVFTAATSSNVGGVIVQACTTPLGTCTLPGGGTKLNISAATVSHSWSGDDATAFTETTSDTGACNEGDGGNNVATMYCLTRTPGTAETVAQKTLTLNAVGNPSITSGNNEQVYLRVSTYSDAAYATLVDNGVVAASIVNQLTVTGRVQERLVFCVFALDDAAGSSGTVGAANGNFPTSCTANEATASSSVDIGVIDNAAIAKSPVDNNPPTATGNDRFGAAMINTNASNGVTLTYYATAAGSGTNELRAFRVPGATCNVSGTSVVDQCFISADETAGETLSAGTERFGMQMACVTNSATTTAGTTANLGAGGNGAGTSGTFNTVYAQGETSLATFQDNGSDNCENVNTLTSPNLAGWNDTGTAQALISSSSVVDDELVKLRFAATAAATTPTGSYTVASTYIATPVF